MRDFFDRLRNEDPEFQRLEQHLKPGYQFALAIQDLLRVMRVDFPTFCGMAHISESELEDVLLNFEMPSVEMLANIITFARVRIEFRPDGRDEAAAAMA